MPPAQPARATSLAVSRENTADESADRDALTADHLAPALSWSAPRLDAALDHARTHPDVAGALVLRRVPPDGYTATPRLDVLRPDQDDAIVGRKNPRPSVRGCIQPIEAEVLLRV
ncbi:hypothetical protein J2Z21_009120 [Streptomyces griseochromogenes]|nr:hypothetical protein [Streptomyces griseochromogenes]MBP2056103.1 hypothetical protein [Streptomyces griseochromogenes]